MEDQTQENIVLTSIPLKSHLIELCKIGPAERERLLALPSAAAEAQTILCRVRRDLLDFRKRAEAACPLLIRNRHVAEDVATLSGRLATYHHDGGLIVAVPDETTREAEFATAEHWRRARSGEIVDFIAFVANQRSENLRADPLATLKALECQPCGWIVDQFLEIRCRRPDARRVIYTEASQRNAVKNSIDAADRYVPSYP